MGPAELPRPLVALATPLALAVTLIAGSVYGTLVFRPFWYGGELPVSFQVESFAVAIAFFVLFTHLAYRFSPTNVLPSTSELLAGPLGALVAVAVFLHILFVLARTVTGLWSYGEGLQIWHDKVDQPLYWTALVGGGLVPLGIFAEPALRAQRLLQLPGALLVAFGLLASH